MRDVKLALQRSDGDWDAALSRWLLRQHITPHSTTSVSPSELMVGRVIRSRLDLLHPDMRKEVIRHQVTQKENHDAKVKADRRFEVSDSVFARNYAVGAPWIAGTIVGIDGPVSYVVRLEDWRIWRRHVDQLRRRLSDELFPGTPALTADGETASVPAAVLEGATSSASRSAVLPEPSSSAPGELRCRPRGGTPVAPPSPAPGSHAPLPETSAPVPPLACCADAPCVASGAGGASASARQTLTEPVPVSVGDGVRRSGRIRKQTEFFGI